MTDNDSSEESFINDRDMDTRKLLIIIQENAKIFNATFFNNSDTNISLSFFIL